jgi:hypothetical protein
VRLELHFPMHVVQLDGHVHKNATTSFPCLQKSLWNMLVYIHLIVKFVMINIKLTLCAKNKVNISLT